MNESTCTNNECTIAETGVCVLGHNSGDCPHRISDNDGKITDEIDVLNEVSVLPSPENEPRFPPNAALGMDEIARLMSNEYCYLIGLLGMPNSGKTACIVSLYLLLSHNDLDGFEFADSRSLLALDELARGARRWTGAMPEQMTAHTKLEDGRSPGFMHLKLRRRPERSPLHLLIPDLPGEWSRALIDTNRTDRWSFLRSVDAVWVMVDGQMLTDRTQRGGTIHRTNLLIERVGAFLSPDVPPVHLVITRLDLSKPTEETIKQIRQSAKRCNIDLSISHVASFSNNPKIAPGRGLDNLVRITVATGDARDDFWPGAAGETCD